MYIKVKAKLPLFSNGYRAPGNFSRKAVSGYLERLIHLWVIGTRFCPFKGEGKKGVGDKSETLGKKIKAA